MDIESYCCRYHISVPFPYTGDAEFGVFQNNYINTNRCNSIAPMRYIREGNNNKNINFSTNQHISSSITLSAIILIHSILLVQ